MYHIVNGRYQKMTPNSRGYYPIKPLKVELGIWQGEYQNQLFPRLRWWDADGNLLLTSQESTQQQRRRAEQERERANRLAAQLRALGVEPEV